MSITVIPRPADPGYADIELHDGRRITWDLRIPEANKLAQALRECDHEPGNYHGDGNGGWLCDACGTLVAEGHNEHVTINWAFTTACLEGECDHVDADGQPEDLSACPTVPPFEVCVDCMDNDGRGRNPERWNDVPLTPWPCEAAAKDDHADT